MKENQFSQSALKASCYRAYHSIKDEPKIFDDYLASKLLTEEELVSHERQMVSAIQASAPELAASFTDESALLDFMMQSMAVTSLILSRARYTEERLKMSVEQGIRQYVNLGAGMDTFAFRHPEMTGKIELFEIDHPVTQKFKQCRLNEIGWEIPGYLNFLPMDFNKENLVQVLSNSPYDFDVQSFISWLGVTYYLPRKTVLSTLKSIAEFSPSGSKIVFDYLDIDAFDLAKVSKRVEIMLLLAGQLGEPVQLGFDPALLADDLANIGLSLEENLSPLDIQNRYFQGRRDKYYACEHAHFACAIVR